MTGARSLGGGSRSHFITALEDERLFHAHLTHIRTPPKIAPPSGSMKGVGDGRLADGNAAKEVFRQR